jgi:hypothetical protein
VSGRPPDNSPTRRVMTGGARASWRALDEPVTGQTCAAGHSSGVRCGAVQTRALRPLWHSIASEISRARLVQARGTPRSLWWGVEPRMCRQMDARQHDQRGTRTGGTGDRTRGSLPSPRRKGLRRPHLDVSRAGHVRMHLAEWLMPMPVWIVRLDTPASMEAGLSRAPWRVGIAAGDREQRGRRSPDARPAVAPTSPAR